MFGFNSSPQGAHSDTIRESTMVEGTELSADSVGLPVPPERRASQQEPQITEDVARQNA